MLSNIYFLFLLALFPLHGLFICYFLLRSRPVRCLCTPHKQTLFGERPGQAVYSQNRDGHGVQGVGGNEVGVKL